MVAEKPRKILFIITDSGIGGTERVLHSLIKGLDPALFSPCAILVLKTKKEMAVEWEREGIRVISFGMKRWPSLALLWRVARIISREKPDIVHAFLFHSIQVARMVHLFNSTFHLVTSPRVNYKFAPPAALKLDALLKNQDSLTLSESEAGKKSLVSIQDYDPSKILVAWTHVDPNKFSLNLELREKIRREWGVQPHELLIGSVGRLHVQKGYDLLVKAFNSLEGLGTSYKAVVVGDGPERKALEDLAFTLSVPIRFVGARTDIPAVLSAFDIYVQSSRYEGLSNALLEAMSVGCACIATSVDGTMDFAKDGQNLVLARPDDSDSLALALATLIEKPSLREHLSAHAKMTAADFSLERMIKNFQKAYQYVCSIS